MTEPSPPANRLIDEPSLTDSAAHWWVRRQDGVSAEEEVALARWLAVDASHAAALERVGRIWSRLDALPEKHIEGLRAALPPALPQRSAAAKTPVAGEVLPVLPRRRWLLDVGTLLPRVTVLAACVGAAGLGWFGWSRRHLPSFHQAYATPRGGQLDVSLPDGSQLRLDTATQLEAAIGPEGRLVRLHEGQAYFAVQARPQERFDVLAGPLRITVVGTRFTVRCAGTGLGAGQISSVSVDEGRVRVAQLSATSGAGGERPAPAAVELSAGQALHVDLNGRLSGVISAPGATVDAWRQGRLVFNDTPLGAALAEFERYVDTGLVVNDLTVAAMRLNGSFDLHQFAAFKAALPQVLPVRLRARADGRTDIVLAR